MENLNKIIDTTNTDKDLIVYWTNLTDILRERYVDRSVAITGVIAEKYRYDMFGLFEELNIPVEHRLPHILANGYNSSREYTGEQLDIKILDSSRLSIYLQLFNDKKRRYN